MLPADSPIGAPAIFPAMERAAWPGSGFHSGASPKTNRLARSDKAMDGKSRPASASWTPRPRTPPGTRAMTRARRCPESSVISRWTRKDCPMRYTCLPPTLPTGLGLWRCLTGAETASVKCRTCWWTGVIPESPLPLLQGLLGAFAGAHLVVLPKHGWWSGLSPGWKVPPTIERKLNQQILPSWCE